MITTIVITISTIVVVIIIIINMPICHTVSLFETPPFFFFVSFSLEVRVHYMRK